jgi:hypothetical protein
MAGAVPKPAKLKLLNGRGPGKDSAGRPGNEGPSSSVTPPSRRPGWTAKPRPSGAGWCPLRVKGPSCERKLGSVADQQREVPGTQGHHPLGSIQANAQCPRRRPGKVREQRSHPTAHIENPPGVRKRKLLKQPSGQAHQDRGPQVAIGLSLGAVVAGDVETGCWSLVGWWGRWHGGKGTLPRTPDRGLRVLAGTVGCDSGADESMPCGEET